jgi:hypothetical protein
MGASEEGSVKHPTRELVDPFTGRTVQTSIALAPVLEELWRLGIETDGSDLGALGSHAVFVSFQEPLSVEILSDKGLLDDDELEEYEKLSELADLNGSDAEALARWGEFVDSIEASRPSGAEQLAALLDDVALRHGWHQPWHRISWRWDFRFWQGGSCVFVPTADVAALAGWLAECLPV